MCPRPAILARRLAPLAALLVLALPARIGRAGEFTIDGRSFSLPDGFVLEKVAGPPLVDRPIVADFDEQGRLYVADSSGTNDPVQKQLAEKPHRILRLEDSNGDGVFDRRTVFADRMMFPEGVMWLDGSVYVAAPPSIWRLTDTDGDGVADTREEWFQGKTLTGCANDLHGPYAGPDGWIYWCKGAFAQQTHERPGKPPLVTRASHIFRCRPDGSGLEPVMTGGMDNPVDVVFTPGGERILSNTFIQQPAGGKRDGLLHTVYGGLYGKVHDVLEGHVRTGPDVMPVLSHLGPAAACGMTRYEADVFGPGFRDNLFTCCFNLQKITRTRLEPKGATFESRDEDFLVGKERDFHPTDILDDADGSLLVIDTGGWYKLCCPTSQLHKPDVLGAIYRVRRAGAAKLEDPRGRKLAWDFASSDGIADLLDDPRPAVRRRAIATLAKRGGKAVPALARVLHDTSDPEARRNAVWALCRIDNPDARAAARTALADFDETVRQVAAHAASVRLDREAMPRLLALLQSPSAQNRRVAAEAIGRLGDPAAVPALLSAAAKADPSDRFLTHSITHALIEIGDPEAVALMLGSNQPGTRLAALIALDQMGRNALTEADVAPGLASDDPATREIASWIVSRHPEWAEALVGVLRSRLDDSKLSDADASALVTQLARFAKSPAVQTLLASAVESSNARAATTSLRAMAQSGLKEVPANWVDGWIRQLREPRGPRAAEVVATSKALTAAIPKGQAVELGTVLTACGLDSRLPVDLRLDALAAVPGGLRDVAPEIFEFLREHLDPNKPVTSRSASSFVLSRASLSNSQLGALADALRTVGPLELDKLLTAFEKSTDEAVGLRLLSALGESSAMGALRVDMLEPRLKKYSPKVREAAESLYARLNVDAAKQRSQLEALLPKLASGDIRRGQAIFNGSKAACLTCHAVGYLGGKVGPDLTRIGQIRAERDLLESILFPSLSFVRSFEPVTIALDDGRVLNGILESDASDELVLVLNATDKARVPRSQIEEMRPGTVSVMPAGLDQQLSTQDLADLVAFLKSRK